jgi:hypothetical protein
MRISSLHNSVRAVLWTVLIACAGNAGNAAGGSAAAQTPVATPQAAAAKPGTLAPYRSRLLGVYDDRSGDPITDVEVFDISTGMSAKTTETGTVSLSFLPDGGSMVRIRKVGYAPLMRAVAISPADTAPLTLTLTRVTELPAVSTKAPASRFKTSNLRGFEEREQMKLSGYFIDDSILRKEEGQTLANTLRSRLPNALLIRGHFGAFYLQTARGCLGGISPDIYLDGVQLTRTATDPIDVNSFSVSDLAGVEYYESTESMPIQFSHTGAGCGALMLWTRER